MWGQSACLVRGAAQRGRFGKHHGESSGTLFVHQTEYQGADDQVPHPRGQSYRQHHPDVHREQGHHEKTAHIHAKHVQESHQTVLKGHWVATSLNPVPKMLKKNSVHTVIVIYVKNKMSRFGPFVMVLFYVFTGPSSIRYNLRLRMPSIIL